MKGKNKRDGGFVKTNFLGFRILPAVFTYLCRGFGQYFSCILIRDGSITALDRKSFHGINTLHLSLFSTKTQLKQ